ncbi:fimbrial protein [Serratia sp. (in: enterobacteria)]|uniref:fimbrial protein n=1 Tax=Serratia sp. (in: enterobacteria) TaxID=616 RepID=UPI00398982DC
MMNKLKSLVRYSLMGGAIAMGLGMMTQAQAVVGQCYTVGGVKDYTFSFNQDFNSDQAADSNGETFWNASGGAWNLGLGYNVVCDCGSSKIMKESFITARLASDTVVANDEGRSFYALTNNSVFGIAADVFIAGAVGKLFEAPFTDQGNGYFAKEQSCKGKELADGSYEGTLYDSGSAGQVHLHFRESVVGTTVINLTEVVRIYIRSQTGFNKDDTPVAIVKMHGSVTVPAKCELKNTNVTVSFGDILSGDFKTAGQMPTGFSKVHEETVQVQCSNLQTTATVSLKFEGGLNTHDQTALKTMSGNVENEDIAIRIEEKDTKRVISPGSLLPVAMNGLGNVHSDNETKLLFYPISATGKPPKLGEFNSTATITVEME